MGSSSPWYVNAIPSLFADHADKVKLATGYVPLLIQMYATAAFDFDQGNNGWLMAEFAFVRGFFLILLFPPIIAWGRKRMSRKGRKSPSSDVGSTEAQPNSNEGTTNPARAEDTAGSSSNSRGTTIVEHDTDEEAEEADEASKLLPTDPGQFDMPAGEQVEQEPIEPAELRKTGEAKESPAFDLVFLRWSLVVDGLMTTIAAFATQRWHIYLGKSIFVSSSVTFSDNFLSCFPPALWFRISTSSQGRHYGNVF